MKQLDNLLRGLALGCILIAGSCAASNDGRMISEDGAVNHPIVVEPGFRELKVQFTGDGQGMTPDEAVKFDSFIDDYRTHGNGSLGISVPSGVPSHAAITFFAERAAASGISRDKILVSTHDTANGDYRVDVSYISYSAHAEPCGQWTESEAFTADNLTPRNFGCATQHNLAAMIADPRDLLGPRRADPADAVRMGVVMDHYEKGEPTAAAKHTYDMGNEQSAPGSDVGKN
jgi:pilus assembly protein CpaD